MFSGVTPLIRQKREEHTESNQNDFGQKAEERLGVKGVAHYRWFKAI
jgi:hypothetical protein